MLRRKWLRLDHYRSTAKSRPDYVRSERDGRRRGELYRRGQWRSDDSDADAPIAGLSALAFVIGRILVYSHSDLPTAYALTKQIQIGPRLGR